MKNAKLKDKRVIPFATAGANGRESSLKTVKELLPDCEITDYFYATHLQLKNCRCVDRRIGIIGVLDRIEKVRKFRSSSTKAATRKKAEIPMLFNENQQPNTDFIAVPKVSSQRRRYVPIGFMHPDTVVGDQIYIVEDAGLYEFGVMTSNVHNAWMRTVCGRLKSDYRYSNTIVYNNFPWPTPIEEQKQKIEKTAQDILKARDLYPDESYADLYDPLTMPPELRKAHTANDVAVMKAYGFSTKMSESDCVGELMRMYQELTK